MDRVLQGFTNELVKLSAASSSDLQEDKALRAIYRQVKRRSSDDLSTGLDKIRGKGRQVSRDYLASAILGATTTPAALLLGSAIARKLHNKEVLKAMKGLSRKRRKALSKFLKTGPLIGRGGPPFTGSTRPLMTYGDLTAHAIRGGVMGSAIQMLRDRFSGSAGIDHKKHR